MLTSSIRQFSTLDEKRFSSITGLTSQGHESPTSQQLGKKKTRDFISVEANKSSSFRLTPLATCHSFADCVSCLENEIKFKCNWCPSLNRCSSGVDRKLQEWSNAGKLELTLKIDKTS